MAIQNDLCYYSSLFYLADSQASYENHHQIFASFPFSNNRPFAVVPHSSLDHLHIHRHTCRQFHNLLLSHPAPFSCCLSPFDFCCFGVIRWFHLPPHLLECQALPQLSVDDGALVFGFYCAAFCPFFGIHSSHQLFLCLEFDSFEGIYHYNLKENYHIEGEISSFPFAFRE